MQRTIKIDLSTASINAAIQELAALETWIKNKTQLLNEKLAILAEAEAARRFGSAYYDGENDVDLYAEPTANGWRIIAEGRAVFFIEFGAGVYYNGSEPYPEPRPQGIVRIGEYGQGKGKRQAWGFYDTNGDLVITHGNPAAMPMFYASEEVHNRFFEIAREVFA